MWVNFNISSSYDFLLNEIEGNESFELTLMKIKLCILTGIVILH